VRLATSALIAIDYHDLDLEPKRAVTAILEGYREALEAGGHAFVLAEHQTELRDMALDRLRDPQRFWDKLDALPTLRTPLPKGVARMLERALPERNLPGRIVHRVAGVGSLGRQRFVVLAQWRGGRVAREAKALAPSAWVLRRLAPDCTRIPLNELPKKRHEEVLLHAMGWETANIHLGSARPKSLRVDVKRRGKLWLHEAARLMADAIERDWSVWRKAVG